MTLAPVIEVATLALAVTVVIQSPKSRNNFARVTLRGLPRLSARLLSSLRLLHEFSGATKKVAWFATLENVRIQFGTRQSVVTLVPHIQVIFAEESVDVPVPQIMENVLKAALIIPRVSVHHSTMEQFVDVLTRSNPSHVPFSLCRRSPSL